MIGRGLNGVSSSGFFFVCVSFFVFFFLWSSSVFVSFSAISTTLNDWLVWQRLEGCVIQLVFLFVFCLVYLFYFIFVI